MWNSHMNAFEPTRRDVERRAFDVRRPRAMHTMRSNSNTLYPTVMTTRPHTDSTRITDAD